MKQIYIHIGKSRVGLGYPVAFRTFGKGEGFSIKVGALYIRHFRHGENRVELNFSRSFWIWLFKHNYIQIVG